MGALESCIDAGLWLRYKDEEISKPTSHRQPQLVPQASRNHSLAFKGTSCSGCIPKPRGLLPGFRCQQGSSIDGCRFHSGSKYGFLGRRCGACQHSTQSFRLGILFVRAPAKGNPCFLLDGGPLAAPPRPVAVGQVWGRCLAREKGAVLKANFREELCQKESSPQLWPDAIKDSEP